MGHTKMTRINIRKRAGSMKVITVLLLVFTVCLVSIIEINILSFGLGAVPQKADAIIILGCSVWEKTPSPALYERIMKGYELYKQGYAKKIIASGAQGEGEEVSEAEAIKTVLVKLGIPEKDVLKEGNSTNTIENLIYSKNIMKKNNLKDGIVVSNYFHLYRCSIITEELGMEASFAKAKMPTSIGFAISSNVREVLSVMKHYGLRLFKRD